ncbi:MAG: alpha-ketoacid dehydrogenase subunit beta, partial [Rhodospirillaceae bacterium]|nr:alpha-ketoacid dehydrogenase subunit beta [Rhodospirillaceae bacterium]
MREISYGRAGMEALVEEMRLDPKTLHLATDAPPSMVEEFGEARVRATPIAENAFSGIAI